ncbi:hypothetical protein CYMTET_25972 [Cymbomonas tetramitiformis]|uniref:RING-type domain-containing protein n=1 Tax=Cymbomonas tetramitiformis TaxID=36881 RepID=A0AAE0KYE1_9CHLO|nr:hypothetical protein CYMTET_25972 [Cymbomonas tetramitiformis]
MPGEAQPSSAVQENASTGPGDNVSEARDLELRGGAPAATGASSALLQGNGEGVSLISPMQTEAVDASMACGAENYVGSEAAKALAGAAQGQLGETPEAPGMLKAVEEEMYCVICTEPMVNAHLLPCSHSFCGECIFEWYDKVLPGPLHLPRSHTYNLSLNLNHALVHKSRSSPQETPAFNCKVQGLISKRTCPICRKDITVEPVENSALEKLMDIAVEPSMSQECRDKRRKRKEDFLIIKKKRKEKPAPCPARRRGVASLSSPQMAEALVQFFSGMREHSGGVLTLTRSRNLPAPSISRDANGDLNILDSLPAPLPGVSQDQSWISRVEGGVSGAPPANGNGEGQRQQPTSIGGTMAGGTMVYRNRSSPAAVQRRTPLITYTPKHQECATCEGHIDKTHKVICFTEQKEGEPEPLWHHFNCYASANPDWSGELADISPELSEEDKMTVRSHFSGRVELRRGSSV